MKKTDIDSFPVISVVIPAKNEAQTIVSLVNAVRDQRPQETEIEVVVVDDGSTDDTARVASEAGAKVIRLNGSEGGNPARARNQGAAASRGDPIVFLDADCTPHENWLDKLLAAHRGGVEVVGGSLGLPSGLSPSARCDYYCGWYHVHPRRRAGFVNHHPPCNLSVRREAFLATRGYLELHPAAYSHEELLWQAELQSRGGRIFFEPAAVVDHHNRPGLGNLLRRNYRWGYSAIETKAESNVARMAWLYRHPRLLIAASVPLSLASAPYIIYCWLRAGRFEPLWQSPIILTARAAYGAGMIAGGVSWLRHRGLASEERRPKWE